MFNPPETGEHQRTRSVRAALLFAAAILAGAAVGLLVGLLWAGADRGAPAGIDPAAVRSVCDQYADLDLSGLAPLCVAAGYQQTAAAWPAVSRCGVRVQPEDLDRCYPCCCDPVSTR